jgi:hypothetical protein
LYSIWTPWLLDFFGRDTDEEKAIDSALASAMDSPSKVTVLRVMTTAA